MTRLQDAARAVLAEWNRDSNSHGVLCRPTVDDLAEALAASEAEPTREELIAFAGRVAALTVSGQSIESLMAEARALVKS